MMSVMRVSFYATLRAVVGAKHVELPLEPGATVMHLAQAIARRWPELAGQVLTEDGQLSRQIHIMIDGRNCRWLPNGPSTSLEPGQTIDVFPPTAGG
jgi:molybdopterin synthase sulfur carrier subunit